MKSLFFVAGILILNLCSIGQSNNSYNQTGVDMVEYIITLETDIKNEEITALDCETVDRYTDSFNIEHHDACDLAESIYSILTNPGFSYSNYVNGTGLSSAAKTVLIDLCYQSTTLTDEDFSDYIEHTVDDVNGSSLGNDEKAIILKICAFGWNALNTSGYSSREPCDGCAFIGGVVGIVGGSLLCGPVCGIVGGLVGFVVGGFLGDK